MSMFYAQKESVSFPRSGLQTACGAIPVPFAAIAAEPKATAFGKDSFEKAVRGYAEEIKASEKTFKAIDEYFASYYEYNP